MISTLTVTVLISIGGVIQRPGAGDPRGTGSTFEHIDHGAHAYGIHEQALDVAR